MSVVDVNAQLAPAVVMATHDVGLARAARALGLQVVGVSCS